MSGEGGGHPCPCHVAIEPFRVVPSRQRVIPTSRGCALVVPVLPRRRQAVTVGRAAPARPDALKTRARQSHSFFRNPPGRARVYRGAVWETGARRTSGLPGGDGASLEGAPDVSQISAPVSARPRHIPATAARPCHIPARDRDRPPIDHVRCRQSAREPAVCSSAPAPRRCMNRAAISQLRAGLAY